MMLLLTLALKGAVVLALGTLIVWLLRGSSASVRHGVWAATFAVLLAVPVFSTIGPAWQVGVLPGAERSVEPLALPAAPEAPSLAETSPLSPAPLADRPRQSVEAATPIGAESAARVAVLDETAGLVGGLDLAAWLGGLWALGAFLVALVWLRALALARRLVRNATEIGEPMWTARAESAAYRSGLRAPARLLRSDALTVPIAWGFRRPAVVLPPSSDGWDAERREAVLLHEMAHLRRRDAWTQVIAQAALALHWPNPLVWIAYRRFMDSREQACDDAVLRVGAPAASYASHLVAVARELSPSRLTLAAVAPMAGRGELETRVRSILDGSRRRAPASRWALGATLALAVLAGGPLAAFQPVAGQDPPQTRSTNDRGLTEREDAREASMPSHGVQASTTDTRAPRDEPTAGAVGETADQTDRSVRRDTVDVPRIEREAARVRRASDEVEREAARIRREADAVDREAARVRRDAHAVDREAARVERHVDAAEREAADVRREAAAVDREAAQIRRQAHEAEREAARVQREMSVIGGTSGSSSWRVSTEASPPRPPAPPPGPPSPPPPPPSPPSPPPAPPPPPS